MIERFQSLFPAFYRALQKRGGADIENVLPPATAAEIAVLEQGIGVPLPESYKKLLRCARGFWLLGGVIQFGANHPFYHRFPPLEQLSAGQREVVTRKGGVWPPASDAMLCFAEYFLEADGDQVLWDVRGGLQAGEYPIYYYAHEQRPPTVRRLSEDFGDWLSRCLDQFGSD